MNDAPPKLEIVHPQSRKLEGDPQLFILKFLCCTGKIFKAEHRAPEGHPLSPSLDHILDRALVLHQLGRATSPDYRRGHTTPDTRDEHPIHSDRERTEENCLPSSSPLFFFTAQTKQVV